MVWAPDYLTLADAHDFLRIGDTGDDGLLPAWITAASRAVDDFCGRQFGKVDAAQSRTYPTVFDRYLGCWVADVDDFYDDDLTVVDGNANQITDYEVEPVNAVVKGRVYTRVLVNRGGPLVIDSESWGWPAVPASIVTATQLQLGRLAKRRDAPFGVAGSPSQGSEIRLLDKLDVDAALHAKPFVRRWWAR